MGSAYNLWHPELQRMGEAHLDGFGPVAKVSSQWGMRREGRKIVGGALSLMLWWGCLPPPLPPDVPSVEVGGTEWCAVHSGCPSPPPFHNLVHVSGWLLTIGLLQWGTSFLVGGGGTGCPFLSWPHSCGCPAHQIHCAPLWEGVGLRLANVRCVA